MVKAEQIVGEAHTQKGTYGRVKVLHAEAVGLPIVLEFFDVLLTTSALVVIAPSRPSSKRLVTKTRKV